MPNRRRPPGISARSNTVTLWPARASCWAAASPAGPDPTTATDFPVRDIGYDRGQPALRPGALGDLVLDPLDRDRVGVDPEHARRLAWRRAEPSGELREVVGRVQAVRSVAPVAPVDEIVPFGDEVPERASFVAERDPAVHAASALVARVGFRERRRRPRASRATARAQAGALAAFARTPRILSAFRHLYSSVDLSYGAISRGPRP